VPRPDVAGKPSGTAVTRIAAALRQDILTGMAAPGSPLREEVLAERFDASRHTVRTALAQLGATGLARAEPYRGTRVTEFDAVQAIALQDLRRALESEAVEILTRQHSGGPWSRTVLEPVEEAVQRLGEAELRAADSDTLHWLEVERAHTGVHRALVAAAGSPRITQAYTQIADELDLLLLHVRPHYGPGELHAQHRQLLEELQTQGTPAIRAHLNDTLARLDGGSGSRRQ
jgi:DNA-binding GntR family transcriptional regulator